MTQPLPMRRRHLLVALAAGLVTWLPPTAPARAAAPAHLELRRVSGSGPGQARGDLLATLGVRSAQVPRNPDGEQAQLLLQLDEDGAQRLAEVTASHHGQRIAVVLVDEGGSRLLASPVVMMTMTGGRLQIPLDMPLDEARALADRLEPSAGSRAGGGR